MVHGRYLRLAHGVRRQYIMCSKGDQRLSWTFEKQAKRAASKLLGSRENALGVSVKDARSVTSLPLVKRRTMDAAKGRRLCHGQKSS